MHMVSRSLKILSRSFISLSKGKEIHTPMAESEAHPRIQIFLNRLLKRQAQALQSEVKVSVQHSLSLLTRVR